MATASSVNATVVFADADWSTICLNASQFKHTRTSVAPCVIARDGLD